MDFRIVPVQNDGPSLEELNWEEARPRGPLLNFTL